jgi:hypothetical protein
LYQVLQVLRVHPEVKVLLVRLECLEPVDLLDQMEVLVLPVLKDRQDQVADHLGVVGILVQSDLPDQLVMSDTVVLSELQEVLDRLG